jgi:mono/diheme cytochrome c family protein
MRRGLLVLVVALVAAGCGGGETVSPTPETVVGDVPQETGPAVDAAQGDPEAGKTIFMETASPACSTCHTYGPAGSTAVVGPNLDDSLQDDDANTILESIVDPSKELTPGFQDLMPKDYGENLDEQQLTDLVAFLLPTS